MDYTKGFPLYHPVCIGNLKLDGNLFLAPIAGYSDRAFRSICIENGASYCTTEMVSAEALVRGSGKTESLMAKASTESVYAVQLFGGNPEVMAKATICVLEQTDCTSIDINAGCPVQKIIKSGAGSVLTREPELLYKIVSAAKKASESYFKDHLERGNVPITVKIRSGWDSEHLTWKETVPAAIEAGASALTIHARTKAQGYEGKANWEIQQKVVSLAQNKIPIFGSGDANSPETARKMLLETGVDGVMFARGAMGDPFLFRRTKDFLCNGTYSQESVQERIVAGFKELELNCADFGEKAACLQMRKKFCAYSSGLRGGAKLREQIVKASTVQDYKNIFAFVTENMLRS